MWDRMGFFTGNLPLDLAVLAWLAAQLIKTVINLARGQGLALSRMLGSGDMPSSPPPSSAPRRPPSARSAAGARRCSPCQRRWRWW